MRKCILICVIALLCGRSMGQDGYSDRAKKYISQYCTLAMEEQRRCGVPAAVTLGQGILETEAGASELMTVANNHFGIKCSNGWTGETFNHDDDAPNECFKKYSCVQDSYRDHSDHLKRNPRYSQLFSIAQTDYAGWAAGLKKCGYATNPQYAQQLIKIIEDYNLQQYTYSAMGDAPLAAYQSAPGANRLGLNTDQPPTDNADTSAAQPARRTTLLQKVAGDARKIIAPQPAKNTLEPATGNNYDDAKLVTVNGLTAFYAYKGELLLPYALKFNIRYAKLLEINELPDGPLPFNTYVYVEKKNASGTHTAHAVKMGESLQMIAQIEGMQLKRLMSLNLLQPGEEPAIGALLELQFPARKKPELRDKIIVVELPPEDAAPAAAMEKAEPHTEPATTQIAGDIAAAHTAPTKSESRGEAKPQEMAGDNSDELVDTGVMEPDIVDAAPSAGKKQDDALALKAGSNGDMYAGAGNATAQPQPKYTAAQTADNADGQPAGRYYTVKKGDTAFSIAKRYNLNLEDLEKWNGTDGNIQAGQVLQVQP